MKRISKNAKDKQREVYALLDSASAILETLPDFVDGTLDLITKRSFAVSFSPIEYLFNILQIIGVDEETIKGWLVDIFTVALPAVEVTVKAQLLKNLKGIVDCHIDPFIPEQYRKPYSEGYFTPRGLKRVLVDGKINKRGVIVNINALDPDLMLTKSPLGEEGRKLYFGQYHYNSDNIVESYDEDKNAFELVPTAEKASLIPEVTVIGQRKVNPYEFVRAADFNAFLWLCIHKSKLPSPSVLEIGNDGRTEIGGCHYRTADEQKATLLDYVVLNKTNDNEEIGVNIGATLTSRTNKSLLSVAIQSYPQLKIVPVSSDWNSCNWYVDRKRYFKENLTSTISSERNYGNEIGVFNIKYMKPSDYECRIGDFEGLENILFTVLPKPLVFTPTLFTDINNNLKIKINGTLSKILFNGKGEADKDGKYTINPDVLNLSMATGNTEENSITIPFMTSDGEPIPNRGIWFKTGEEYKICNPQNMSEVLTPADYEEFLMECYPGLTLYELNYDYVMGMRLFDPQVLTKRLIDNIFNPYYYSTFGIQIGNSSSRGGNAKGDSASYANGKYKILNMVKRLIEEEDELSDCFFTFTNEDYEEMLKESAEARYHETPYRLWNQKGDTVDTTDIDRILGEYPVEGTLNEQREVLSRTIEQAMITAEENSVGGSHDYGNSGTSTTRRLNSSTSKVQFATDMFSQLTATMIDALITPKLLLLLEVNKQIIGDGKPSFSIDALMGAMKDVVRSVVKELLDLIMQKMLDYITSYIRTLISKLAVKYAEEQLKAYLAILVGLLSFYKKGLKIANECINRISSRFGKNGDAYNQAISEVANGLKDFDFDLPNPNLNYFDEYNTDTNNDEPKISDC